jgi:DnaJ like chaperone protein
MNHRDYLIEHPRLGKILGAILGFIMAGPVGAFIGIFIGNFFDQGLSQHLTKPHWPFRIERNKRVREIFIQATFSLLGAVAKANGRVSEESIHIARRFMSELGLNTAQRQQAQLFFNQGKQSSFAMQPLLMQIQHATTHNPLLLKLFITLQYEHAQQIGLSTASITVLNQILTQLGFSPLHTQHHHERYQSHSSHSSHSHFGSQAPHSLSQAYAVLSVSPEASKEQVKRAYRRLISQHHPDKIVAKGANAERIKAANEKTQAITKAYEQICISRGW